MNTYTALYSREGTNYTVLYNAKGEGLGAAHLNADSLEEAANSIQKEAWCEKVLGVGITGQGHRLHRVIPSKGVTIDYRRLQISDLKELS